MAAIDTVEEIAALVRKYNDVDLMQRIADLQTDVVEQQNKIMGLVQQNREKVEQVGKLKKALALEGRMVCEHSAYYEIDDDGNKVNGPFCTNCFDNEFATRRLLAGCRPKHQEGRNYIWVQCPKCQIPFESYEIGEYLSKH